MNYFDNVQTEEDGTGKRLYVHPDTGAKYPSITTILSHHFSKKFEGFSNQELLEQLRNRGAMYGNILHDYAEQYVLGNELVGTTYIEKFLFKQIKPYIEQSLSKVYFTEKVLIDDETQTAGRVDCVGVWNGIDSVIDFKNSRKEKFTKDIPNYFIQAAWYAHTLSIEQIVILMTCEETFNGKLWVANATKFYPFFLKLREKYRLDNGI